ncbi:sulfotransferase domain-containing protein [Phenylobacterium sp.]|uniref:sulfotransferase domain-containing protein n=1 Tax=Phenylobacterium sp. TaxID=1871053 RepID=UPI002B73A6F2|nr:sulfotransferase domain-containing protein [Phenylobacterium sp.]HLZ74983.1 sulfotransferase domain-containing protein [Phenylobacterium sp.]
MAADPKVAFIVAGVQKGGTTALFDYLGDEPGLSLSREKEVHFFDDEDQDWAAPDYRAYHAQFGAADGRLRGEATPIYLYWPNSLERIAAYNAAVRLIVMLRDPVERAWSHWKMEYARGVETKPFAWCIREGRQRLFAGERPRAQPWGFDREVSYVERGFYGEQLERALRLFARDQLLILKSADLRADPGATLGQVRAFLGLPQGPAPAHREVHVGREMDYGAAPTAADIAHLRTVYARDAERLADLAGIRFA